jgi:DNA-directed RNA polymerase specialized sigma24 family protein
MDQFTAETLPTLLAFAHRLTADPAEANRLTEATLAAAQRRWPELSADDDTDLLAETRRLMIRIHTHWWRRCWAEASTISRRPSERRISQLSAPDDEVRRALRALPPRTRAAVVLRVADGLGDPEIADLLSLRATKVKALRTRGLAEVRAAIDRQVVTIEDAG